MGAQKKTRAKLKAAQKEQRLVRVVRRKGWTQHDGYVVGLSREWCALHSVDGSHHDGLVVVRLCDIRRLTKPYTNRMVSRAALEQAGHWPPTMPHVLDLSEVRSVLFTAGSLAPVLAFATENTHPGRFFVANVYRITKKYLDNVEIRPSGRWSKHVAGSLLTEVTRVDLDSPYVAALRAVAGPPPLISAT